MRQGQKMIETELTLKYVLKHIEPVDEAAIAVCKKRWDGIAKPLHSLGWLEDTIARIAG